MGSELEATATRHQRANGCGAGSNEQYRFIQAPALCDHPVEAWEIAERGPMPLFLADIHLYRARLFFREAAYPWQSPQHDLAEARQLIFKHGYLRRKEELEDAEKALKHLGNVH